MTIKTTLVFVPINPMCMLPPSDFAFQDWMNGTHSFSFPLLTVLKWSMTNWQMRRPRCSDIMSW